MQHLMSNLSDELPSGELTYEERHTPEMLSIRADNLIDKLKKKFFKPNLGLLKRAFIAALIAKDGKGNHLWTEFHIRTFCGDLCFTASNEKKAEWSTWFTSRYPALRLNSTSGRFVVTGVSLRQMKKKQNGRHGLPVVIQR
jgi:hypothetical protein